MSGLHLVLFGNDNGGSFNNGETPNDPAERLALLRRTARVIEDAAFDAVFFADTQTFGPSVAWPYQLPHIFEPFTLAADLLAHTERLGVIVTATTTFDPPFSIARQTLALDHLSGGRIGLNIVTTAGEETATNYTLVPLPDHAERYRIAEEAVQVITGLWDGFEDGASGAVRADGVINDVDRIHPTRFTGDHFSVDGIIGSQRSPQGRPVLLQAGSSADGTAFAARHAEVVFSGHRDLDTATAFAQRVRTLAQEAHRTTVPKVLPGLFFVTGRTPEEAQEHHARILDNLVLEVKLGGLKEIDIDLTGVDLDSELPPLPSSSERHQTGLDGYRRLAEETRELLGRTPTVREFLQRATFAGYFASIVGGPVEVADEIERWHEAGAADGFVLFPGGGSTEQVRLFATEVVPILQQRGLYRHGYDGTTLRDHLGLDVPTNSHLTASAVAVS